MIHVEQALEGANAAYAEDRLEEAERELLAVLEFDELEPRALRLLGRIAMRQGQPQRAAELFQSALKAREPGSKQAPSGPMPTPTLAELYAQQGHIEAAAKVYRELLNGVSGEAQAAEWRRRLRELEQDADGVSSEPAEEKEEAALGRLKGLVDQVERSGEVRRLRAFLERLEARVPR
ncbi:tetratricopeptide repeat protein [Thiohalorhabdus sp. Cl-TMA]|uniref:Tol-pal system YbgF family protein n=1 Tax=Thiohalorhabdus methylotrophus TaxID=3242694 RepID=A0ABV4TRZ9_9GAMM